MTAWEKFGWGPWEADDTVPQEGPDEKVRARQELPRTLVPVAGEGVAQSPVFDPAMKHYGRAMRPSEPRFADDRTGDGWQAARELAVDHVLAAVAGGAWADHLVLRGSVLLRAWYGAAAREPGDLDFVVQPQDWELADPRTDRMLDGIARAAEELSLRDGLVRLDAAGAVSDSIWTYDRVPGRRLVIPWTAEGLPGGSVQLDFVFNEPLPVPAELAEIPRRGGAGEPIRLPAAGRALSLAWKIMWLVSDSYPEGKDLYDALLLAEDPATDLSLGLLRQVFTGVDYGTFDRFPVLPEFVAYCASNAEWFEFAKDHPRLAGAPDKRFDGPPGKVVERLAAALAPVYALDDDGSDDSPAYRLRAAWFASGLSPFREALASGGAEGLQQLLVERHFGAAEAIVLTRELLGRRECSLERAAGVVAEFRAGHPDPQVRKRAGWLGDPDAAFVELRDGTAPQRD
ncbi:nucleotidyl transferase AbiEii/AbiGii toxin family protein [Streptomyces sp. LX-29]|uniref:nucleotidyl transferase AbiEii/AbiGii toxin family protein n=1 Tax=Streptomyces sp. LX-29 TaxID=2900152 RepID=UPI00240E12E1|nr:nucleotidyl transferase AbiEii/AbiGii toxin family protein [Streptomyces sp. LX-29]WFB05972.1 nucleotidyl transferase AbiEii/AbiGii toxin family protein [Streptomyces sp. LX-29]